MLQRSPRTGWDYLSCHCENNGDLCEYCAEFEDTHRDFLAEAYKIIEGRTMLLAQREHLVALVHEYGKALAGINAKIDQMIAQVAK